MLYFGDVDDCCDVDDGISAVTFQTLLSSTTTPSLVTGTTETIRSKSSGLVLQPVSTPAMLCQCGIQNNCNERTFRCNSDSLVPFELADEGNNTADVIHDSSFRILNITV